MRRCRMCSGGRERLGELDFALMSIPDIVNWVGSQVVWTDAEALCRRLEKIKPGLVKAFRGKYGAPDQGSFEGKVRL